MSTTIKRVLSLFLCAALLFGIAPLTAVHAADPTSGTCGENLTWSYNTSTATLTISGTGAMSDYDYYYNGGWVTTAPWNPYYQTMQTLVINSGVTSIGDYAFAYCGLMSVTIPDSVTSIGNDVFSGCIGLTSVTIPDSVTSIGYGAFQDCKGLTSVTIPDSVTSIGDYAFIRCTGLTSVTIPDSVTSIGEYAFYGCTGLTAISVSVSNPNYSSDSFGVLYNKSKTELIQYPIGNTRASFTIPDSVMSIGDYAFYFCTGLKSVNIPNSVTSIGNYAFDCCASLTSVTIPSSVTSIGDYAFAYCGLMSVTIPDSVTSIGNHAFERCTRLTSVTIPDSVMSIGSHAFSYCTGLTSVTIGNSVTSIGDDAFAWCEGLTSVTIPDSVTSIGSFAFYDCTGLTSVNIPNSVTSIGNSAFSFCTGLTSVTIPDSVTSIGEHAFKDCTGLTSVTIGNSVTSIGFAAFYNCTGLTDVYFQGTQAEWNEIKIDESNESLLNATIHFNSTPPHVHSYTETITKQPTCKEEGVKTFTCSGCGASYTEPVAKLAHTPKTVTIPATCTATGAQYDICEVCGETLSDVTTLPKLDHTYTETITKQPTCKEAGVKTFTCSGCGESYTEPIAKLSHTPKTVTIPATCTATGAEYTICEVCGETLSDVTTLPKLDHTYTETLTKQPTCKEAGVKTFTCSGCGTSYTEPVARLAHTPGEWQTVKEPTETETGKAEKRCTVCGETLEEKELPKLEVVKDETTGIELSFAGEDYNGDVSVKVEQSFDGAAFNLVNTQTGAVQQAVYDITLSVNGAETQPNGKIKVKIPVPAGYDPAKTFVYHVNTATGKLEKMNAVYENGFMVFETDHFSFYAIVEAAPKVTKVEVGDVTINYKDSVTLKPTITADPGAKYTVKYSSSDPNKVKVDEKTGEVTGMKRGSATITVTVTDGSGNTVKDTCTVTVKYTVLQWIIVILLFGWLWY